MLYSKFYLRLQKWGGGGNSPFAPPSYATALRTCLKKLMIIIIIIIIIINKLQQMAVFNGCQKLTFMKLRPEIIESLQMSG